MQYRTRFLRGRLESKPVLVKAGGAHLTAGRNRGNVLISHYGISDQGAQFGYKYVCSLPFLVFLRYVLAPLGPHVLILSCVVTLSALHPSQSYSWGFLGIFVLRIQLGVLVVTSASTTSDLALVIAPQWIFLAGHVADRARGV